MSLELQKRLRGLSPAERASGSPDSRTSVLSIDELSTHGGDEITAPRAHTRANGVNFDESTAPTEENGASSVEFKLQSNLKQQQEHYARQRQLLEELQGESALAISPTAFSSSSKGDDAAIFEPVLSSRPNRFELDLGFHAPRANALKDDNDDEVEEIERLQRKAKAIAEYHARVTQQSSAIKGKTGRAYSAVFSTSRSREDTSNEALRKQLELLRRLQLENNRFRHENRSLREQNEVLEEQATINKRETKRLNEEIQELTLRIQHDQVELAAVAQNLRKIKQLQKQITALQGEKDQLQCSLQEAIDESQQRRLKSQGEIESMVQEIKHLKRSMRQSRQQESVLNQRIEEANELIAGMEKVNADLKRQVAESTREASDLAARLCEKTTQIESIEGSATQCVERMEASMDALQKAHTAEREKRKKLEKLRDGLQSQVATLESETSTLQDQVRDLESLNSSLQQRLQDWKLERKQDKKFQDAKTSEFQEQIKADMKTIGSLRDHCATLEDQLEVARSSLVEVRKEVAQESNALRKEVEALRNYIEDAQRAPVAASLMHSANDDASHDASTTGSAAAHALQLSRQRREELWVQLPELQFLQGAVGGLRNETMNFVNEFQHAKHQLRQQAAKLQSTQDRVVELEHARSEDGVTIKELQDQKLLAEQAREIVSQEKLEILKWSQQTCEKNEWLEGEVNKCATGLTSMMKKARRTRDQIADRRDGDGDGADRRDPVAVDANDSTRRSIIRLINVVERDLDELWSRAELLFEERAAKVKECSDRNQRIGRLQNELEEQRRSHDEMLREVEALHERSLVEKQKLYTDSKRAVEEERDGLELALEAERVAHSNLQTRFQELEMHAHTLEQDASVFASVVHLFALFVPPLVLQVNDLLVQKRILMKENSEFAAAIEQVECIGQVLRELVPGAGGDGNASYEDEKRLARRRRFRRVLIAVFAINRFQRGGFGGAVAGTGETAYGVCTSLKAVKKKKTTRLTVASSSSSSSCLPPQTMIKVLPGRAALSRLNLRAIIERLKAMDLMPKLRGALDSTNAGEASSLGNLLVEILTEVDPAVSEVVTGNTDGGFHCRALLERRRTHRRREQSDQASTLSTVDLIRKRILALGKRLEDLHYQRNVLQKGNYEFQFQLEQQSEQLEEMEALGHKNDELQEELQQAQAMIAQQTGDSQKLLDAKKMELESKAHELTQYQDRITMLEQEVHDFEKRVAVLEVEKTELRREVLLAQTASAAEEEKLQKSRIGMDRQAEELRNLRQSAKRAHELHQHVTWQLEQELIEKASLNATIDHLRKQKETLEKEVYNANVRVTDDGADELVVVQTKPPPKSILKTTSTKSQPGTAVNSTTTAATFCASYDRQLQEVTERVSKLTSAAETTRHHIDIGSGDSDDVISQDSVFSDRSDSEKEATKSTHKHADSFRNEWRRLDMSAVFDDDPDVSTPGVHFSGDTDDRSPLQSQSRQRGDEIDKVNTAVHDYMDKIDEKLQQMYGIPRSASRLRPPSTVATLRTGDEVKISHMTTATAGKPTELRRSDRTRIQKRT